MTNRQLKVNCPTCKEIVAWLEQNQFRPFCSERCKLIDFGEWASERHVIAGEPVDPEQLPERAGHNQEDE